MSLSPSFGTVNAHEVLTPRTQIVGGRSCTLPHTAPGKRWPSTPVRLSRNMTTAHYVVTITSAHSAAIRILGSCVGEIIDQWGTCSRLPTDAAVSWKPGTHCYLRVSMHTCWSACLSGPHDCVGQVTIPAGSMLVCIGPPESLHCRQCGTTFATITEATVHFNIKGRVQPLLCKSANRFVPFVPVPHHKNFAKYLEAAADGRWEQQYLPTVSPALLRDKLTHLLNTTTPNSNHPI